MRILAALLVVFTTTLMFLNRESQRSEWPPEVAAVEGPRTTFHYLAPMYEERQTFRSLAKPGAYTVVEVYSDTCGICKVLESSFPALLEAREDFVIRRVNSDMYLVDNPNIIASPWFKEQYPNSMLVLSADDDTLDKLTDYYQYHGTPHVEIYSPNGSVIAKDAMFSKDGTEYLQAMIRGL